MRTISKKVYWFSELSDKAKEKALDTHRLNNDMPFLSDAMQEELEAELLSKGYEDFTATVYFSLGHCQGDGAMFEFSGWYKHYRVTVKQSGLYSHKYSNTMDIYDDEHEDAPEAVYESFKEEYYAICDHLEKYGYDYIDEENDEDRIAEYFAETGTEFYEDGSMYY